jgi:hypothetical protein
MANRAGGRHAVASRARLVPMGQVSIPEVLIRTVDARKLSLTDSAPSDNILTYIRNVCNCNARSERQIGQVSR